MSAHVYVCVCARACVRAVERRRLCLRVCVCVCCVCACVVGWCCAYDSDIYGLLRKTTGVHSSWKVRGHALCTNHTR